MPGVVFTKLSFLIATYRQVVRKVGTRFGGAAVVYDVDCWHSIIIGQENQYYKFLSLQRLECNTLASMMKNTYYWSFKNPGLCNLYSTEAIRPPCLSRLSMFSDYGDRNLPINFFQVNF